MSREPDFDAAALERALAAARHQGAQGRAAALGLALAAHWRQRGERLRARDHYSQAEVAAVEAGDRVGALDAAIQLAQMGLEDGDARAAVRWSERALGHGGDSLDEQHQATLLHNMAVAHAHLKEVDRALVAYARALERWGVGAGRRSSLIGRAALLLERGDFAEAVEALREALTIKPPPQDPAIARRSATAVAELLAQGLMGLGRHAEAAAPAREAVEGWKARGEAADERRAALLLTEALLGARARGEEPGALVAGLEASHRLAALSRASGDVDGLVYARWMAAEALERAGRTPEASEAWTRLGEVVSQTGGDGAAHLHRAARLELDALEGQGAEAWLEALPGVEVLYATADDAQGVAWCRRRRVEVLIEAQRWGEAAEAIDSLLRHEAQASARLELLAHKARLHARDGDLDAAAQAARQALALPGFDEHALRGPLEALSAIGSP